MHGGHKYVIWRCEVLLVYHKTDEMRHESYMLLPGVGKHITNSNSHMTEVTELLQKRLENNPLFLQGFEFK